MMPFSCPFRFLTLMSIYVATTIWSITYYTGWLFFFLFICLLTDDYTTRRDYHIGTGGGGVDEGSCAHAGNCRMRTRIRSYATKIWSDLERNCRYKSGAQSTDFLTFQWQVLSCRRESHSSTCNGERGMPGSKCILMPCLTIRNRLGLLLETFLQL